MTHEFKEIITVYQQALQKGIKAVVATVVDIDGSSYRRPGVGMLIQENGHMTGAVSGGCVEKEVLRQAQSVFSSGKPKIMTYDGRYRLGCEGILYILIEPFEVAKASIDVINTKLQQRIPFQIKSYYIKEEGSHCVMGSIIEFEDDQLIVFSDTARLLLVQQNSSLQCFERIMQPCFRLIIVGTEHDAKHLCILASVTGWEVEVIGAPSNPKQLFDFPGAFLVRNETPENLTLYNTDLQTAIILMTHNFAKDVLYLQAIKNVEFAYIGLLGPARRREKLLSALIAYAPDISDEFIESIHGPAGLNVGAETPQEIAISIIAEILSVIRAQNPISLQDKKGGIHSQTKKQLIDEMHGRT
ncbi:XdhC/CoxI family protein [Aquimarina addita]|uniref:XdhC/CoxI family protein n=1 Tax=Aquimarina addita TaxID=870485 RepID=A0ABP6UJY9_9FLAO